MKKLLCVMLALLLTASLFGCAGSVKAETSSAAKPADGTVSGKSDSKAEPPAPAPSVKPAAPAAEDYAKPAEPAAPAPSAKPADGTIGGKTDSGSTGGKYETMDDAMPAEAAEPEYACEAPVAEPMAPGEFYDDGYYDYEMQIDAGTLTAGEWNDAKNTEDWLRLLNENSWYTIAAERALFPNKFVRVTVKDGEHPCFNTAVELLRGDTVLFTGRTDVTGAALLFYGLDTNKADAPDAVRVGEKTFQLAGDTLEIQAAQAGVSVTALDLMLMIDTTGSMGDELEYLKVELRDVVNRVAETGANLSIRISVNFYRDEEDDYVVKYYDFRDSVEECTALLKQEFAEGGGDYPEAVHTALENAVTGHTWRDEAVKLCFFVLDAPPHSEEEISGINANIRGSLTAAAGAGIRIIPVASSGVDTETEFLLRSFAITTGGTYIFLTDDSGIGGEHLEATVGEYEVEPLNDCMVRVVCEFCGLTVPETAAKDPELPGIIDETVQIETEPRIEVPQPITEPVSED